MHRNTLVNTFYDTKNTNVSQQKKTKVGGFVWERVKTNNHLFWGKVLTENAMERPKFLQEP